MERITYRIPAHYVAALITDDYSGLSYDDEKKLNDWLDREQPGYATCPEEEPFFCHHNDIDGFIGCDCYDIIFIQH